jgi:cold shock CspA family protein
LCVLAHYWHAAQQSPDLSKILQRNQRAAGRGNHFQHGVFVVSEVIGKVKFVSDNGCLFLTRDDGRGDVFSHIREFEANGLREPEEGERYQCEIVDRPKGPMAIRSNTVL